MAKLTIKTTILGLILAFSGATPSQAATKPADSADITKQAKVLSKEAPGLNPEVAKLSLVAYNKAREQGLDTQQVLTIVDYSKPSTEPRMWVFDLKTNQLLFQELVAHGSNSGDNVPTSFSDDPSSHKSSLGLYITKQPYVGHHGYSLRLAGLEPGYNGTAESRDVVVHSANYVSEEFAKIHGRLGRSWGCFALSQKSAQPVINTIKDGTLLFAYYPDQKWLSHSNYLT